MRGAWPWRIARTGRRPPLPRQEGGVRRAGHRPDRSAMGGIRVERASGSDEPLRAAAEALRGRRAGGRSCHRARSRVGRRSSSPCSRADGERRGWRQMTGAPVIPIGLWGTEKVWPRSSRLPNVLNVSTPPTMRVRVGPPVELNASRSMPTRSGSWRRSSPSCRRKRARCARRRKRSWWPPTRPATQAIRRASPTAGRGPTVGSRCAWPGCRCECNHTRASRHGGSNRSLRSYLGRTAREHRPTAGSPLGADLPPGWALIAVGGYARGALCPGSDLDVDAAAPAEVAGRRRPAGGRGDLVPDLGRRAEAQPGGPLRAQRRCAARRRRPGDGDVDPAASAASPATDAVGAEVATRARSTSGASGRSHWLRRLRARQRGALGPVRRGQLAARAEPEGRPRRPARPRRAALGASPPGATTWSASLEAPARRARPARRRAARGPLRAAPHHRSGVGRPAAPGPGRGRRRARHRRRRRADAPGRRPRRARSTGPAGGSGGGSTASSTRRRGPAAPVAAAARADRRRRASEGDELHVTADG